MSLALVDGGGVLVIRDSEEPASLARPTTFAASVDDLTGAITGGTFTAAPSPFQFDITDPVEATVYVTANFTQLNPGTASGSVTMVSETEAEVTVNIDVKVDLHIEVGRPSFATADCTATPVSLRLGSTANYDFATDQVTLTDADFRVPAVPSNDACPSLIADGVNERLAGGGHSISMTMAGEIPEIFDGTYRTATALSVEPAVSRQGDEVALTAQVSSTDPTLPASPPPMGGLLHFLDGATLLGTVPVDGDGRAVLTTTDLPVGRRSLTARFQGDGVYIKSTSPTVTHLVAAAPTVTLPDPVNNIVIDGNPRPVTVGLANPAELGGPIDDARLELTVARVGSLNSILTPDRMSLEHFDGTTWVPVTLTQTSPRVLTGSVPGVDLAPGETLDARFRYRAFAVGTTTSPTQCLAANPTCPGPLTVTAKLISGDGARTFASNEAPVNLVEHTRRATTATFAGGVVRPHTVRQGYSLLAATALGPTFGGVPWAGFAEAYLDGVQVPLRDTAMSFEAGYTDQYAVRSATIQPWILLPDDIEPGTHQLTVRYLGDAVHGPAETTGVFTVIERLPEAHPFVCREKTLTSQVEWGADMVFDAPLPGVVRSGTNIAFSVADARLLMHRRTLVGLAAFAINDVTTPVGSYGLQALAFDLAGEGTASGMSVTRTGDSLLPNSPYPAPESAVDQTFDVDGVQGNVTVSGAPGEVVPVELSEMVFSHNDVLFGFPLEVRCTARGGAMRLGEVEIAGTSVAASPVSIREGAGAVDVEARTFPSDVAGTVSFSSDRDGSLGDPVAVSSGVASIAVDDLSPGVHVITAAFDAAGSALDSSGSATVTVLPRYDCPAFAQSGNAAVVRLVYLELLGRCPDQAGFDYWKGRLDGGTSREVFARSIARTPEAVGRVVDDAYDTMLGRAPDAEGRAFWVRRLQASGRYDALLADLGASGEFWSKAGSTNAGFVTRVYDRLLNRAPDEGGLDYWVGRLDRGTSRRALILALANLDEPLRRLVDAAYGQILDRAPSGTERTSGIGFLRRSGDRSALYAQLMDRAEFVTRAGQFPNQED